MTVQFRSWCVDFDQGYKAFEEAKKFCKSGVDFQLVGTGAGDNCLSWSKKILKVAGIENIDSDCPRFSVSSGMEFKGQSELEKFKPSEGQLAYWARGVPPLKIG
ncbi:hypothetical protein [Paraburkholderia tagetis]|uniref:Uncharacterized protein n=1 Tax=Paraburkholderia tagetis TaxID=2913261 RepID=A0A9X1UG76_9BURK|nr:hypothetical protein [Paraburkholderia tagetis]MCG5072187.1 hypothetical protein [Paraburkholderia tagetis]